MSDKLHETEARGRWEAKWSGGTWSLCIGSWELLRDGKPVDTEIPFQHEDAGTFGSYAMWGFGGESGWIAEWEYYEDGLARDAWCDKHREWLSGIAPEDEWFEIFDAFQAEDWRRQSCGGCI